MTICRVLRRWNQIKWWKYIHWLNRSRAEFEPRHFGTEAEGVYHYAIDLLDLNQKVYKSLKTWTCNLYGNYNMYWTSPEYKIELSNQNLITVHCCTCTKEVYIECRVGIRKFKHRTGIKWMLKFENFHSTHFIIFDSQKLCMLNYETRERILALVQFTIIVYKIISWNSCLNYK